MERNKGLSAEWDGFKVARDCMQRVYLTCAYEDRNEVKRHNAKWDAFLKRWYIVSLPGVSLSKFEDWIGLDDKVARYLHCPFEEKDDAKSLGAVFDSKERMWFIPSSLPESNFEKWLEPAPHKHHRDKQTSLEDNKRDSKRAKETAMCLVPTCRNVISCADHEDVSVMKPIGFPYIHAKLLSTRVFCDMCAARQAHAIAGM